MIGDIHGLSHDFMIPLLAQDTGGTNTMVLGW